MPKYLVTNAAAKGGVFLLDSTRGEFQCVLDGSFRGITRGPDGCYYVASGSRNRQLDATTIHRLEPGSWKSEQVARFEVKDSHDLRWIGGHFYLVASVGNQILRLDRNCRLVDRMQIVEDEADICHVNCLMELDGRVHCSIFTLAPGTREEKRLTGVWHTEGKILRLDWDRRRYDIVYEPLAQPHNLTPHQGSVYLVESHKSCVSRVDLATGGKEMLRQYSGFVRGLHLGPDEALLGVCVMYKKDRRRLKPLPWLRQWYERLRPFSGVLVLDPKTWKVRRGLPLEKGEVYEILPVEAAGGGG